MPTIQIEQAMQLQQKKINIKQWSNFSFYKIKQMMRLNRSSAKFKGTLHPCYQPQNIELNSKVALQAFFIEDRQVRPNEVTISQMIEKIHAIVITIGK